MKTLLPLSSLTVPLLFLTINFNLKAQIAFGVKGGLTASNVLFTHTVTVDKPVNEEKSRLSIHFGYLMKAHINDWLYLQPELLYMEKGFSNPIRVTQQEASTRFHSLNIPLLIGAQFRNFQLALGPEIEHFFKAFSKIEGEKYIENGFFEKNTWLFNANAELGYQIKRFQISVRGSLGLNPIQEGEFTDANGIPAGTFNYRNVALQTSLAYLIFK